MKSLPLALLLLLVSPAFAQTSIVGTNVQSTAATPLASGSWCINAQCFAVTSGVIASGASVLGGTNGTVTITDGGTNLYLTVPSVNITGSIFNWGNFVQPASTTVSGRGTPYLACRVGAKYQQTDIQAPYNQWNCLNVNGVPTWTNSNPPPQPPSAPDILVHNFNLQNQFLINGVPAPSGYCPDWTTIPIAWTNNCGGGSFTAAGDLSGNSTLQQVVGINQQNLAALGAGIFKFSAYGVPSLASPGTDYVVPGGNVATANALATAPTGCTNGLATGVGANGNAACNPHITDSNGQLQYAPGAGSSIYGSGVSGNSDGMGELSFSGTTSETYDWANAYTSHPECAVQAQATTATSGTPWVTYTSVTSFTINFGIAFTGNVSYLCSARN